MDRRDRIALFGGEMKNWEVDERAMTARISDEDTDTEHEVRLKWQVCETCNGRGKHVNPSIDAHGITHEEFAEDPDFHDSYLAGAYDVDCVECKGRTTALVVDRENTRQSELEYFDTEAQGFWDGVAEDMAERRMGA